MSKTLSQNFKESQGFDCSAYLGHGLQWPVTHFPNKLDRCRANNGDRGAGENRACYIKQHESESVAVRNWGELLQEETKAVSKKKKPAGKFVEEQYYHTAYTNLIKWMDEEEIIVQPPPLFAGKREEIQRISLLADEALGRELSNTTSYNRQTKPLSRKFSNTSSYKRQYALGRKFSNATSYDRQALVRKFSNTTSHDRQARSSSCEDLANEVAMKAIETPRAPRRVVSPGGFQNFVEQQSPVGFQNFVEQQLVGFGAVTEKPGALIEKKGTVTEKPWAKEYRKRRLCRHFVKGFCMRGDHCDFRHDSSLFCSDDQKVFLGGLPLHVTPTLLKTKLEEQGLTVLNKPRIMRGFTPQVCLGSVQEAEKLIAQRYIFIDNRHVDVRPYKDKDQLRQVVHSGVKRSVFLGGIPENTTGEMIVADLQRLDIAVVGFPVVKNGYAPRVLLESLADAEMLVALKRVVVNGTVVDVRPFVNHRKRR